VALGPRQLPSSGSQAKDSGSTVDDVYLMSFESGLLVDERICPTSPSSFLIELLSERDVPFWKKTRIRPCNF